ncbi:hypothetical protein PBY51_011374 [Eleginops maclovinus]|uniref:Uncharacterized protein n=1 Tax=Eleginops maclovinus TaxID=56733 RepID=A0AAN8AL88_ELEMC|nr:hypothetical protein PBY51_011374 [Eleginops maclovinus]
MLVSGARPRALQARKRRRAFFQEPRSFVGPCVTLRNFPSRKVLPQRRRRGECEAFLPAGAINRTPERTGNELGVCSSAAVDFSLADPEASLSLSGAAGVSRREHSACISEAKHVTRPYSAFYLVTVFV